MSASYIIWNMDTAKPANEGLPMEGKKAMEFADALERDTGDAYVVLPAPSPVQLRRLVANA